MTTGLRMVCRLHSLKARWLAWLQEVSALLLGHLRLAATSPRERSVLAYHLPVKRRRARRLEALVLLLAQVPSERHREPRPDLQAAHLAAALLASSAWN